MQTTIPDTDGHIPETSLDLRTRYEQSEQTSQEDKVKDYPKLELSANDVTSEYLHELPPFMQAKMSVGKKVYSGCIRKQHKDITVYLMDADMWQRFSCEGTEMIITKKGRRVFPVPSYAISELNPQKLYDITLEINSVDQSVYKFSNGEWIPLKESSHLYPTPVPTRSTYLHPYSPNTGLHWMKEPIHFSGLKISNNLDAIGTIVLQSMRKYMMSLIISELNSSMKVKISQPETVFFAVTQYQNEKVTQMKIEHNPFANGFRFATNKSSKDKTKRQLCQDADSEEETKSSEVSLKDRSPLGSPKMQGLLNHARSEVMPSNATKLVAYLKEKRHVLKNLLPAYLDQLKIGPLKQEAYSDPSPVMPSSSATYTLYNNASDFSRNSNKDSFIFSLGEANPLAQVRQFGEFNRCSDMEQPLSLVKKKKMEDHTESSRSHCKSISASRLSSRGSKHYPRKYPNSKDTSCNFQSKFKDGLDAENTKECQTNSIVKQDEAAANLDSQFSSQSNGIIINNMFRNCDTVSCHTPTDVTKRKHEELKENKIGGLTPTNSVSKLRSTEPGKARHQKQEVSKDLRPPEQYNSVALQTERWVQALRPEMTLKNGDIWATTHEVVISSEGRPMFPFISLFVNKLTPDREYHISLKLVPSSRWLYDYKDHEWTPLLEVTEEQKKNFYHHPGSPKKGCQWGSEVVFDRLRLSTLKQGKNTLKVQLRRQYLPLVIIESENQLWEYPLKDATFITVKIDRSPYQLSRSLAHYHTSTPEFERMFSESLVGSAHRKQANPKRRTVDGIVDYPHTPWLLENIPTQSSPLDLKTSDTSRTSPAAWNLPSSSSMTSVASTTPALESVMPLRRHLNLDCNNSDTILICDYSDQHEKAFTSTPSTSVSSHLLPIVYSESDVESMASSAPRESPASSLFYLQNESETESVPATSPVFRCGVTMKEERDDSGSVLTDTAVKSVTVCTVSNQRTKHL